MRRRLMLTAAAAGITGAIIPSDALAQQLDEPFTVDLDFWDNEIAALGRDHMNLGAEAMRPKLTAALAQITGLRDNGRLATHTARLLVLFGRAQGVNAAADRSYTQAQAYAMASGDAATIAWVHGRIALGLCDNPDTAHLAGSWAQIALAHHSDTHLGALGTYLAHYARARAAAVTNQAPEALAHLEQARAAYDNVDTDLTGSEWSYDPARFFTDNSYILDAVGRAGEASRWAEEARDAGVSGRFLTHLALHPLVGRHRAGDASAAAEAASLMAAVPTQQQSTTLRLVAAQAGA